MSGVLFVWLVHWLFFVCFMYAYIKEEYYHLFRVSHFMFGFAFCFCCCFLCLCIQNGYCYLFKISHFSLQNYTSPSKTFPVEYLACQYSWSAIPLPIYLSLLSLYLFVSSIPLPICASSNTIEV